MNALIIDTTADELAVVLLNNGNITSYIGGAEERRHSCTVMNAVDSLLTAAGITACELSAVGAVAGPGSFTGIRIGVATANAMAAAIGAKRVTLTSLEALAEGERECLALISCGHGEFYALKRTNAGEDEYLVVAESDVNEAGLRAVYYTRPDPDKLAACFRRKFENGDFSDLIKPFYIKKSSAEK